MSRAARGDEIDSCTTSSQLPGALRCGRWRRAIMLMLVLLVAAVLAAPIGVARYVTTYGFEITGEGDATFHVRVDDASIGWLSPVDLTGVSIVDDSGRPVATAAQVVSQRNLLSLAAHRTEPGRFVIDEPDLCVRLRPGGSNLEDLIAALRSGRETQRTRRIAVTIEQGRIAFVDQNEQALGSIEEIAFDGGVQRGSGRQFDAECTSVIVGDGHRHPMQFAIEWQGEDAGLPFLSGKGSAAVKLEDLPATSLQPVLTRSISHVAIQSGRISGSLLVDVDFQSANTFRVAGEVRGHDVEIVASNGGGAPNSVAWTDEAIKVGVSGQLESETETLRIDDFSMTTRPFSASGRGIISDLASTCRIDLQGALRYDIEPFVQSWATDLSEHVSVTGLATNRFEVSGPLAEKVDGMFHWSIADLSLDTDLSWTSGNVFGVESKDATILARLQEGVLTLRPQDVPVSGGRFLGVAHVMRRETGPVAAIEAGTLLQDVSITPEMCALWLKFVSPILADATQVDGSVSLDIEMGEIPIREAESSQITGTLSVQQADVRPGSFARDLIDVIGTVHGLFSRRGRLDWSRRSLIHMKRQQIPFVLNEREVQHERAHFQIAGIDVYSSGSVGFDESLNLTIEIPLDSSWIPSELFARTIEGEVVRIPVSGTLDQPQFDLRALRDVARRLAAKAAGGLLERLLD